MTKIRDEVIAKFKKDRHIYDEYILDEDENYLVDQIVIEKQYSIDHNIDVKEFEVQRFTNGMGDSHLIVITEPAIEDVHIGTVAIIPYANEFKDPKKVVLQVDDKENPIRANHKFAIVSKYIYE